MPARRAENLICIMTVARDQLLNESASVNLPEKESEERKKGRKAQPEANKGEEERRDAHHLD